MRKAKWEGDPRRVGPANRATTRVRRHSTRLLQHCGASQQGDHEGRPYYATKRRGRAVHSDGLSSPGVGPGHGNTRVAIACANNVQGSTGEHQPKLPNTVTLSTFATLSVNSAMGLVRGAARCFAALSMTVGQVLVAGVALLRGSEMLRCAQHDKTEADCHTVA